MLSAFVLDEHRWNVGLTRAIDGLLLVGNLDALRAATTKGAVQSRQAGVLANLLRDVWERQLDITDRQPDDNPAFAHLGLDPHDWANEGRVWMQDYLQGKIEGAKRQFDAKSRHDIRFNKTAFSGKGAAALLKSLPNASKAEANERRQQPGARTDAMPKKGKNAGEGSDTGLRMGNHAVVRADQDQPQGKGRNANSKRKAKKKKKKNGGDQQGGK